MIRYFFCLLSLFTATSLFGVYTVTNNLSNSVPGNPLVFRQADDGSAIAVWIQNGTPNLLLASYRTNLGVWTPVAETVGASVSLISEVDVQITPTGTAVVSWKEGSGTGANIRATYRDPVLSTWSTIQTLNDPLVEESVDRPKVGINSTGLIYVVWDALEVLPGTDYLIRFNTIDLAQPVPAWGTADTIFTSATAVQNPDVAVAPTGFINQAIVAWADVTTPSIVGSTEVSGVWGGVTTLSAGTPEVALNAIQVQGDELGRAAVVWPNDVGGGLHNVQGILFGGTAWLTTQTVSQNGLSSMLPTLSMAPSGEVLVGFELQVSGTNFVKQVRLLPQASTNFGPLFNLNATTSAKGPPSVYINGSGNASVGYVNNANALLASIYPFNEGFSQAQTVTTSLGSDFGIGIDPTGNAIAVFQNQNNVIFASLGTDLFSEVPQPARNLQGQKNIGERFLGQEVYNNVITWQASLSGNIVSYRIFRNGIRVASVFSFEALTYQDQKVNRTKSYTYSIVAVDDLGLTSTAISITL